MVHTEADTIVRPSHQRPCHGKEGPGKTPMIEIGVNDLKYSTLYGEGKGIINQPKFITPVMDVLCNGPPHY